MDWWTHGRLVNYDQPNPAENDISQWLIQNPQRVNLGTTGLLFKADDVTEDQLENKSQTLDLWSGKLSSSFTYNGSQFAVETWSDPASDTVGISVQSDLGPEAPIFYFDFPLPTTNKFDAPFVGTLNGTTNHTTTILNSSKYGATIRHDLDETTYYASFSWNRNARNSRPSNNSHRYILTSDEVASEIQLSVHYSPFVGSHVPSFKDITQASEKWWDEYWNSGAFIDFSATNSPNATELQRITILSQYLLAVNSASSNSPQGELLPHRIYLRLTSEKNRD
jgi:hypothetical protein